MGFGAIKCHWELYGVPMKVMIMIIGDFARLETKVVLSVDLGCYMKN